MPRFLQNQVLFWILLILRVFISFVFCGFIQTTLLHAEAADDHEGVVFNFEAKDQDSGASGNENISDIERLFRHPTVVQGLSSSAKAIDQSVENLMESLFYRLMDQSFSFQHDDYPNFRFNVGVERKVYSTQIGKYVVIDKIGLGPEFGKEISRFHSIPINLGVNGKVEIYDIYHRTDGERIAEQDELPLWRSLINNWFYALPLLTSILPPSFNPNEMYDPLRMVKLPFIFPTSLKTFEAMPEGTIRSYLLSGGISFGVDFATLLDAKSKEILAKSQDLMGRLPYGIFQEGTYRINVLKKSENVAWVGYQKVDRKGHQIGAGIGRKLFVLAGTFPYFNFKGVPIDIFPIDFALSQALVDQFDQLYGYDLTKQKAQEAYLEAVRGNFVLSHQLAQKGSKNEVDTGVYFHFTKERDAVEAGLKNEQKLYVWRQARNETRSKGEVEVVDANGKYYVLEAFQEVDDEIEDMLVGKEDFSYKNQVEIKVDRAPNGNSQEKSFTYTYTIGDNPILFTAFFDIHDNYTNSEEYEQYVYLLRRFSGLKLSKLPAFTIRDERDLKESMRERFFVGPTEEQLVLHPLPTVLGKFSAQAAISFSSKIIEKIVKTSTDDKWNAFAKAFGIPTKRWTAVGRDSAYFTISWFKAFFAYPLRFFNLRLPSLDAIKEAHDGIRNLELLKTASNPMQKLEGFYKLFDTDHPLYLARALIILAGYQEIPRRVSIYTSPHARLSDDVKAKFRGLNNKTYTSKAEFPPLDRYRVINQKLEAFYAPKVDEKGKKPIIEKVIVDTKKVEGAEASPKSKTKKGLQENIQENIGSFFGMLEKQKNHIYLTLKVRNATPAKPAKIYIRFETSGAMKLGKLVLAEEVFNLSPTKSEDEKNEVQFFEFFLTGPKSPLESYVFDKALGLGGEFQVTIMVSRAGKVWSDERIFKFQMKDGYPRPPAS